MKTSGREDGQTAGWMTRLALLCLAVVIVPRAVPAQGAGADERAIMSYRLSDAVLAKYIQVSRAVVAAGVKRDTDQDDEDAESEQNPTIDEIAAMYDKHPVSRRALTQAGLTSQEFVIFTFALMQAGMAAWLVDQHGWGQLPKEVARENVLFYQKHRAQLDSLTAELKERNQQEP